MSAATKVTLKRDQAYGLYISLVLYGRAGKFNAYLNDNTSWDSRIETYQRCRECGILHYTVNLANGDKVVLQEEDTITFVATDGRVIVW